MLALSPLLYYECVCNPFPAGSLERGGRMRRLCVLGREHPNQGKGEGRTEVQLC